ncbi:MAG: phytanoyl-CoA dioxygenase [Saprospiraceae bacterium]|nr:phytanoyl-CoA dioxygenase [Saprospiraceae bacterium]
MKVFNSSQIDQFIHEGFIAIPSAFSKLLASECLDILWKYSGCNRTDRNSWIKPVVRLGDLSNEPFLRAANTAVLTNAYNEIVGQNRWITRRSLGSFPIRFPSTTDPQDTGWHVDASFPGEDPTDYMSWRINIYSRGRGLLMLFLFSDVSDKDAPTKIRVSSHWEVAKILQPFGQQGLSFMELAERLPVSQSASEVLATGEPGTVYLCHPFLAHAAQMHRGDTPRFMAQPPLQLFQPLMLSRQDHDYSPVETAVRLAVGL